MTRPTCLALALVLASATPTAAQTTAASPPDEPAISIRAFVFASEESFAASRTFNAVFGRAAQPLWGGGAQVVFRQGPFIELGASRFTKTGERTFLSSLQAYHLGIPMKATLTPFEIIGGYRFRIPSHPRIVPYVGAGVGWYRYEETTSCPADNRNCVISSFVDPGENIDTRHAGALASAGVEVRVHRWIGVAADAQLTHVTGILGTGGVSKEANEKDLGGIAGRVKVVIGR